ncbi:MAG: dienelactone hydrolase family protein [Armatimonadetes bacterium]|nr:dienelactone hydrolase family protein [Armatimonadota bacterium]
MKEFAKDPAFRAEHLSPEALDFVPQTGKMGTFAYEGGTAKTFLVPPAPDTKAGVIVIHEWWGLNDHIKREAEALGRATGYAVAAIDLYDGRVATSSDEASKFIQMVDDDRARKIVTAAPKLIEDGTMFGRKLERVGVVGYCFGGGWSFQTALLGGANVDACVLYYGMPELVPEKLRALQAPVLGVFGNKDRRLGPELVGKFAQAMAVAAKPLELRVYDADHGFANPSNPKFDKANAKDAWKAMLVFFKRYL